MTEATDGFLDPDGRCRGSFTVLCPLTGSRIEIPITRMIDAGLRGQKIVDDSATVSNIDVSFTSSSATGGPPRHRSRFVDSSPDKAAGEDVVFGKQTIKRHAQNERNG